MQDPEYALKVFDYHLKQAGLNPKGAVIMEIGPGDSLFTAVVAHALGAKQTDLVDEGSYASQNVGDYKRLGALLHGRGLAVPKFERARNLQDILSEVNARYLTEGLRSLKTVPDKSIDFIFSHAVLEHIDRAEVALLIQETLRVLKPTGVCYHLVDLMDHLGGKLNNLRFSEKIWESAFFKNAGFYTNRVRFSEFKEIFERAGFEVQFPKVVSWPQIPTPLSKMAHAFKGYSLDDLRIQGFDVIARPLAPPKQ